MKIHYILLCMGLTGCMGVYEGGFECPPGKGVGCKSISEVNELINQHSLAGLEKHDLESRIWFNPNSDSKDCSNCSSKLDSGEFKVVDAKNSI